MLQNRVDPWGNLIRTTARGAWMGNRGVIHDEDRTIIQPFKLQAWLICVLQFKDRRRQVMTPNRYTELFFLDEATAFAAGHRPCAECRRKYFNRFKTAWLAGNPEHEFNERTPIWKIDAVLHKERINRSGVKITYRESFHVLPNGSFVTQEGRAFLVAEGLLFPWTPFGYEEAIRPDRRALMDVLTPRSVINVFRAGYLPQMAIATGIPIPL